MNAMRAAVLGVSIAPGAQIGRILAESARFNIGDVDRNVNTPIFSLLLLGGRVRGKGVAHDDPDRRRERPADEGRFWIDPATGGVLMSELTVKNRKIQATIDVSYQSEPLLGLPVPIEMRERYENRKTGSVVAGRATYGRFRQLQVTVDEKLTPIVRPR
jgi:hypothetical protein